MTYWVVTMSMHKLTAGSGYDYLTRQVAALDATDKGHVGLADYYSAKGESPGRWVGAGMDGIDGLAAGTNPALKPTNARSGWPKPPPSSAHVLRSTS